MPSLFTKVLRGEEPGRLLWQDSFVFVLLAWRPIKPGHALVIPREEVDHWVDLEPGLAAHLFHVAQKVGKIQQATFKPTKIGLMVGGIEVRHVHLHLVPIEGTEDLRFDRQDRNARAEDLDDAARRLREGLA